MIIILSGEIEGLLTSTAEKRGMSAEVCLQFMIVEGSKVVEPEKQTRPVSTLLRDVKPPTDKKLAALYSRLIGVLYYNALGEDGKYWDMGMTYSRRHWNATVYDLAELGRTALLHMQGMGKGCVLAAEYICREYGHELQD